MEKWAEELPEGIVFARKKLFSNRKK